MLLPSFFPVVMPILNFRGSGDMLLYHFPYHDSQLIFLLVATSRATSVLACAVDVGIPIGRAMPLISLPLPIFGRREHMSS